MVPVSSRQSFYPRIWPWSRPYTNGDGRPPQPTVQTYPAGIGKPYTLNVLDCDRILSSTIDGSKITETMSHLTHWLVARTRLPEDLKAWANALRNEPQAQTIRATLLRIEQWESFARQLESMAYPYESETTWLLVQAYKATVLLRIEEVLTEVITQKLTKNMGRSGNQIEERFGSRANLPLTGLLRWVFQCLKVYGERITDTEAYFEDHIANAEAGCGKDIGAASISGQLGGGTSYRTGVDTQHIRAAMIVRRELPGFVANFLPSFFCRTRQPKRPTAYANVIMSVHDLLTASKACHQEVEKRLTAHHLFGPNDLEKTPFKVRKNRRDPTFEINTTDQTATIDHKVRCMYQSQASHKRSLGDSINRRSLMEVLKSNPDIFQQPAVKEVLGEHMIAFSRDETSVYVDHATSKKSSLLEIDEALQRELTKLNSTSEKPASSEPRSSAIETSPTEFRPPDDTGAGNTANLQLIIATLLTQMEQESSHLTAYGQVINEIQQRERIMRDNRRRMRWTDSQVIARHRDLVLLKKKIEQGIGATESGDYVRRLTTSHAKMFHLVQQGVEYLNNSNHHRQSWTDLEQRIAGLSALEQPYLDQNFALSEEEVERFIAIDNVKPVDYWQITPAKLPIFSSMGLFTRSSAVISATIDHNTQTGVPDFTGNYLTLNLSLAAGLQGNPLSAFTHQIGAYCETLRQDNPLPADITRDILSEVARIGEVGVDANLATKITFTFQHTLLGYRLLHARISGEHQCGIDLDKDLIALEGGIRYEKMTKTVWIERPGRDTLRYLNRKISAAFFSKSPDNWTDFAHLQQDTITEIFLRTENPESNVALELQEIKQQLTTYCGLPVVTEIDQTLALEALDNLKKFQDSVRNLAQDPSNSALYWLSVMAYYDVMILERKTVYTLKKNIPYSFHYDRKRPLEGAQQIAANAKAILELLERN